MMRPALIAGTVRRAIVIAVTLLAASNVAATEWIRNGSFEESPCKPAGGVCKDWNFTGYANVTDDAHTGSGGMTAGGQGDAVGTVWQSLNLDKGVYLFSFWYAARSGGNGLSAAVVKIAGKTVFPQNAGARGKSSMAPLLHVRDSGQHCTDDHRIQK
ncbi:hypothetical protein [Sinorhizobium psoraleae]|uniref:Uncharacterized protein n=1 Tax=Sinorhizobium psoraleae TaxID=520838 RepID=A0ABT4KQ27_9HYPH|nr:hypothetical protein [Sinorhizobium psoraleae]MCZ4093391.1 hypothetical protein [Sinorhizobium psoraleae]